MVKEGLFREDLYFRLASQKIQLPPLKSRLDDIQHLAEFFLEKQKPRYNKTLTQDGIETLKNYSWPGNVRELKRVCEQLALTSPLPLIRSEDVLQWVKPLNHASVRSEKIDFSVGLNKLVENYEASVIQSCLNIESDMEKVAQILNVSKSNLYKKIKDYNLKAKGD